MWNALAKYLKSSSLTLKGFKDNLKKITSKCVCFRPSIQCNLASKYSNLTVIFGSQTLGNFSTYTRISLDTITIKRVNKIVAVTCCRCVVDQETWSLLAMKKLQFSDFSFFSAIQTTTKPFLFEKKDLFL